jgi:hypothetical protein
MLLIKNVPWRYFWRIGWRLLLANTLFFGRALSRGQIWPALSGVAMGISHSFASFGKRRQIQFAKTVTDEYIWRLLVHDLPPNARALRALRSRWRHLRGKA